LQGPLDNETIKSAQADEDGGAEWGGASLASTSNEVLPKGCVCLRGHTFSKFDFALVIDCVWHI